jgi:nitrogen regulatory protein PII-like uncharacterized protein
MPEKIILITNDLASEDELYILSMITEKDIEKIAKELEKELPAEIKGLTNANIIQQTEKPLPQ